MSSASLEKELESMRTAMAVAEEAASTKAYKLSQQYVASMQLLFGSVSQ